MVVRPALPRRLYSWVRRWWLKYRMPHRRPVRRSVPLNVEILTERSSPTSFGITAPIALAAAQRAQFDGGMDSAARDSWRSYGNGITTASPPMRVIYSPPSPKTEEVPLHTSTQLPELVIAFGSPRTEETLDELLNGTPARNAAKPASPKQENNVPDNAALAGAGSGGGGGGASTPNAGGGGGGEASGGGGGGGANWNQLLGNNVSMASNAAATPLAMPSIATASVAPTTPSAGTSAPPAAVGGIPAVFVSAGTISRDPASSSSYPDVNLLAGNNSTQPNQKTFTTPGTSTWTAPAGVTSVSVRLWGGGGGGGAGGYYTGTMGGLNGGGGGGGGGAYVYVGSISVTPGSDYSVVVGAGGAGGIPNDPNGDGGNNVGGKSGGNSYFGDGANLAQGGWGGQGGLTGGDGGGFGGGGLNNGGSGGRGKGDIWGTGGGGGGGGGAAGPDGWGGVGGDAIDYAGGTSGAGGPGDPVGGTGGAGGDVGSPGQNGQSPGGGGGGGGESNGVAYAGGKGGDGLVIITWVSANAPVSGVVSGPVSPSCNCGCPGQPGGLIRTNIAAIKTVVATSSANPVRYADGVVTIAETDLHSNGFGFAWGQTRSWPNSPGYTIGSNNGNGWVDTYTPHLIQADGATNDTLIIIANGTSGYFYDLVNGVYQARFNDPSQLSYNSGNDTYTLIDGLGDRLVFNGFGASRPAAQRGELASYTDATGVTMAATSYTSDGHIAETQRSTTSGSDTITESWLYSYLPSTDANAGLLSGVTLRQQVNGGAWSTVRQVQYTYYDGSQQYGGNLGDLMTATVLDGNSNVLDTSYYRYYTPADLTNAQAGYVGGLKYVFTPASYERLTAALGTNPSSLTDAQVAPYADNYFQYDSQQRVTLETVQGDGDSDSSGGLGTYTYSYTASNNAAGIGDWAMKTVVTNPDGSSDTVYTNYAALVLLDDHYDPASGLHTIEFYAYNDQGQLVLDAAPSAVSGYNDSYADLLNNVNGNYQYLKNDSGLIARYGYYTTTTATETTAGGVASYLADARIQQGQQGTLIPQETWQYYAHAFNGQTIAPVATDTVYRNDDGTGAQTTTYAYTWFTGTATIQSQTVTAPVIAAAQNGPGAADVATAFFDQQGNAIWRKDPDGYLHYAAYDAATGAMVKSIVDVDTTQTDAFANLPSGWSTPASGGLNLVTTDEVDALGRTVKETSPGGNITYYVYLDAQHEVRIYQGWNSSTGTPTGPTQVIRQDAANGYTEALTMTATPNLNVDGTPNGSEAISDLQSLIRDYVNAVGQVIAEDKYFNLGGLAYAAGAMGTLGVNYYRTQYGYDNRGRLVRTQTANGTIYRTVYDNLDRAVSDWVGTNDTPASGQWSPTNNTGTSNMVMVSSYQYDNGGVGDGNLTQAINYPDLGAAAQVTQLWYDWRDRLVAAKAGVQASESDGVHRPIIVTTYDNLNEAIQTQQYDGDGVTPQIVNGVLQALDPSLLRAQEIDSFDDQGRLYRTQVYSVNPTTGAVSSSALATNYYYDHRGNGIAESAPGGLWSKSQFDGAGREVMSYTTDGLGGTMWTATNSVTGDTVLEQLQTIFDADSNAIETIYRQRFDNATGTGALGDPTSGIGARVYYAAAYYDQADRLIASVDAGTNGGAAWTRPASVPASSPTLLVTTYAYNTMGLVQDVTSPQGIVTRTLYDNLGRVTKTIQNYTGGTPGNANDVATEYGYDGNNHVLYLQADKPDGSSQRTAYVYSVTTATGSGVNSNDILSAIQHPDPTTGVPSASEQDSYQVNALSQTVQYTDRNGTVHQYTLDVLGRITADAVTTLGVGVDGSVRRIEYGYDSQGNLALITTYDAASGGNIVNQVLRTFNGLGQLTTDYQSNNGAVVPSTTRKVQYAYNEMANGANNSRLVSMTYAGSYILGYNYSAGLDDRISRLSWLSDNSPLSNGYLLESYKYLGLATVVERDHPQTNINQTYIQQAGDLYANTDGGDRYTGLDRFDRVIDQNWVNATTGQSTDRFQYGYSPDGDVLYRQNLVDATMSELYQYDNLHQLINFQRGTLNATHDGIVGTPSRSQSWSADALGNFDSVTTDGTTQTRTHDEQNQITGISGAGAVTYDDNGNLTADGSGNSYVYDAWNRLVRVDVNGTTAASYTYDGLGRRIVEIHGSDVRELYYSAQGQVLAEWYNGLLQARNVWSPVYVNALAYRDQARFNNGVLNDRILVQQDANWNVTALVNPSNLVLERYVYDPFGAVTVLSGEFKVRSTTGFAVPYGFQGMRYDWLVSVNIADNRVYHPALQRWLQTDPIGLNAGNNVYQFTGNNPINLTDPSGLQKQKNGDDLFREAGKRNGVPGDIIELILDTAKSTTCEKPRRGETHNYCEKWAETFRSNLDRALNKKGYKDGLKDASKGGIGGPLEKTIWFVPGSLPIFDPDQDHTAMKITFKDGTTFYIDCSTISAMNVNNLTNGPSHIGLPGQIPPSWKKYLENPPAQPGFWDWFIKALADSVPLEPTSPGM